MNKEIIEHLFEFWKQIGDKGGFLKKEKGFNSTNPPENSWPSKVFNVDIENLDLKELEQKIHSKKLPNSVAVYEQESTGKILTSNGYSLTSTLKAMALITNGIIYNNINESDFLEVCSKYDAGLFAQVASDSFGYPVKTSTIIPLYNDSAFKLFLGKHQGSFPSCGIIYLDKKGNSGIHMIGTKAEYRGMGLGKKMTQLLVNEALKNQSKKVYLVASQAGERIYSKMGFETYGVLESYSLPMN
ncbi:GNAT family N-acetyltransferase [Kriegella aquimaris]|uniref:Acetyltransferase (GNAT) domain-containing protein n=1 Tax=Kriegella aquimaris TaxID=192904 RepID=A0A1G9SAP8_9FLAO|nr:GNAT family N-acetyltransferase [Kriegella aquimaris]SDM32556.1 Acetyltransferase (GNAT) domain-containing protein [Kriegella aquimaris]